MCSAPPKVGELGGNEEDDAASSVAQRLPPDVMPIGAQAKPIVVLDLKAVVMMLKMVPSLGAAPVA